MSGWLCCFANALAMGITPFKKALWNPSSGTILYVSTLCLPDIAHVIKSPRLFLSILVYCRRYKTRGDKAMKGVHNCSHSVVVLARCWYVLFDQPHQPTAPKQEEVCVEVREGSSPSERVIAKVDHAHIHTLSTCTHSSQSAYMLTHTLSHPAKSAVVGQSTFSLHTAFRSRDNRKNLTRCHHPVAEVRFCTSIEFVTLKLHQYL